MPTSTPGGAISKSALFTHPSSSTRVQSPERPSTRSGADGASVPAGWPSGDRYSTVRRADSTRDGSTGAEGLGLEVVSGGPTDRKSTRLNSSHLVISYAVFCLKKKKKA